MAQTRIFLEKLRCPNQPSLNNESKTYTEDLGMKLQNAYQIVKDNLEAVGERTKEYRDC